MSPYLTSFHAMSTKGFGLLALNGEGFPVLVNRLLLHLSSYITPHTSLLLLPILQSDYRRFLGQHTPTLSHHSMRPRGNSTIDRRWADVVTIVSSYSSTTGDLLKAITLKTENLLLGSTEGRIESTDARSSYNYPSNTQNESSGRGKSSPRADHPVNQDHGAYAELRPSTYDHIETSYQGSKKSSQHALQGSGKSAVYENSLAVSTATSSSQSHIQRSWDQDSKNTKYSHVQPPNIASPARTSGDPTGYRPNRQPGITRSQPRPHSLVQSSEMSLWSKWGGEKQGSPRHESTRGGRDHFGEGPGAGFELQGMPIGGGGTGGTSGPEVSSGGGPSGGGGGPDCGIQ